MTGFSLSGLLASHFVSLVPVAYPLKSGVEAGEGEFFAFLNRLISLRSKI